MTPSAEISTPLTVKFDAAFIERRMREHQEFREHLSCVLAAAIIDEILADAEEGRWTVL